VKGRERVEGKGRLSGGEREGGWREEGGEKVGKSKIVWREVGRREGE